MAWEQTAGGEQGRAPSCIMARPYLAAKQQQQQEAEETWLGHPSAGL